MTITARYPGRCSRCGASITPGQQIEWTKGSREVRHTDCAAPAASSATDERPADRQPIPADRQPIGAKGTYQGRTVYVVARTGGYRGREVTGVVQTRDGQKMLVVLAGGRRTGWVPRHEISIERTYDRAWSFAGLANTKRREANGEGCYMCGRLSCEGARGGLCEED